LVQLTSVADHASLAREQAALRRVAVLVAANEPPGSIFAAVAREVAEVFQVDLATVCRFEREGIVVLSSFGLPAFPAGSSWPLDVPSLTQTIHKTGRPARIDGFGDAQGLDALARDAGVTAAVGAPILVGGSVFGSINIAATESGPFPADTESRLAAFTELISTAISNSAAQEKERHVLVEQAALRRVATLVAAEADPEELFSAVSEEVAQVLACGGAAVGRFDPDGPVVIPVGLSETLQSIPVGMRIDLDDSLACTAVYRTGRTARKDARDDDVYANGSIGDMLRGLGLYSSVATPISVAGRLWGTIITLSAQMSLPAFTEERLEKFSELLATAIANAESRKELATAEASARALVEEQAALRRVATLVARGVSADELFVAVSNEIASLYSAEIATIGRFEPVEPPELTAIGVCDGPNESLMGVRTPLLDWLASTTVYRTGRTARKEVTADQITGEGTLPDAIRAMGFFSTVSTPIVVEGELWGVLTVSSSHDSLPPATEQRIESFSELVATAIANAQSRGELAMSEARARELAEEQAALRRVATLVAQGVSPGEIFSAVSEEVERVFRLDVAATAAADVIRFEGEEFVMVGALRGAEVVPLGSRWGQKALYASTQVFRTGRSARVTPADLASVGGPDAEFLRSIGYLHQVACPILLEGRLWGVITMNSEEELPPGTEERLEKFTDLVATAIANAESRGELAASEARARELAREQTALRRVATLVAQGATADRLFSAVAEEVGRVIDVPMVAVQRYETDGTLTMVGVAGDTRFVAGSRWPVEPDWISGMILATGRPARRDDYSTMPGPLGATLREDKMTAMVGVPIVVEGNIWGLMVGVGKDGTPIPADAEERLARFTELVATAVSNASTRTELLASRARVVGAADETRRRLERDLHDGIQQWLVALALKARKASTLSEPDASNTSELSELADELVSVINELREISRGIHPAILSDAGLDDALAALARRSGIRVDLDIDFAGRYEPTVEATVYYVVAESVTNAVKHAHASVVDVRGGLRDAQLAFEITDDGVGGADPRGGTGMIGLRDRVDTLGGSISFESPAGGGTTVRVLLPARRHDLDERIVRTSTASAPASG
jgi:GAF domain-containing protein/two-component sensor histidine kinase